MYSVHQPTICNSEILCDYGPGAIASGRKIYCDPEIYGCAPKPMPRSNPFINNAEKGLYLRIIKFISYYPKFLFYRVKL